MVHLDMRPANCFLTTSVDLEEDKFDFSGCVDQAAEDEYLRTTVESRLVQRRYSLRVGDFGHCSRQEDKRSAVEGELFTPFPSPPVPYNDDDVDDDFQEKIDTAHENLLT
jgi:hypothetical protein